MLQVNHRTKWAMASFFAMPKIQWVDSRILLGPWPMSRKTPPFDHPRLAGQSDWIHPEVILGDVPHQKIGLSSGYPLKLYIYYIIIVYMSCPCHLLYLLAGWLSGLKTVVPELSVSNSMASRPGASLETVCIPRLRSSMDNPQPKPAIGLLANAPSETMGNYGKLWETMGNFEIPKLRR